MSYNQIADTTITKTREDGTTRTLEFILKEFDGLGSDDLPVVGDPVIQDGSQNDELFKGSSSKSVTLLIKDTGTLPDRIRDAGYQQFQLVINETESGENLFEGFVLPGLAEYTIFNKVKSLEFTASGAIKDMQNDPVEDAFRTWREIYTEASTSTGITRDVDFITRIREQSQGPAELVPNLLRANEADLVNTTEANRFEAIRQMNQQFNWRLIQHNGRWVVVDLYEMWKNPQSVRRFVDDGAGSYSITNEDHLVTLDKDNSIRNPKGRGEEAIGRIVMQRELTERADWAIEAIQNQSLSYPPGQSFTPSITKTSGKAIAGDKIDFLRFDLRLTAKDTISGNTVAGTLRAVEISFESEIDDTQLWYDYETGTWIDEQKYGQVQFALIEGQSQDINMATDLPPIPEAQIGTVTIRIALDITFTEGSKADIEELLVLDMSTIDTLLPDDEVPVLYHQHSSVSQDGAGKTIVYPMWSADTDSHVTGQFMQFFESLAPWSPIILWKDEYTGEALKLAEISAKRKSEMTIGKRSSFDVFTRDTQGVDMLSVIDFDDGENTHRCLPIHIKRYLFSGFVEIRMVPMTDANFDYESAYSFTRIESSDSKVGSLSNIRPAGNTFLTGAFFNTLLNKAMSFTLDIVTTADLSGTVTTIPVNKAVTVVDGDTITLIDGITLRRQEFIVDGDQSEVTSIAVEEKRIVGIYAEGSYVSLDFDNVHTGILASKFAFQIFSKVGGVGVTTADVSGLVDTLPVNLFTQVREGQTFAIPLIDRADPIYVTVSRTDDYTGAADEPQLFDAGIKNLPIVEQPVTAPAGSVLAVSGIELQSRLHVDPSQILATSEKEKKADAIGTLSSDRSGTGVTTIPLKDISDDVQLLDGQKLRISAKDGSSEEIVVDGDQLLVAPTDNLSIVSKNLTNSYAAGYSWVKEPSSKSTHAIAGLTLSVQGNDSAIATLQARVTTTEQDISGLEDEDTVLNQAILDLNADLNSVEASLTASIDILEDDTRTIMRQNSSPNQRPSGDPLEEGDLWIDNDDPDDAVYFWDGNSWEPWMGNILSTVAGLDLSVTAIEDGYVAKAMLYTDGAGGLASINVETGLTDNSITISADQVTVNGIVFDDGAGLIRSSDFDAGTETGWRIVGGSNSFMQIYNVEIWGTIKDVDQDGDMVVTGAIYIPSKSSPDVKISSTVGIAIETAASYSASRSLSIEQSGTDRLRIYGNSTINEAIIDVVNGWGLWVNSDDYIRMIADTYISFDAAERILMEAPVRLKNYTRSQILSIAPALNGMIVWNTTSGRGAYYDGSDWRHLNSGSTI